MPFTGKAMEIGVNPHFLFDGLDSASSPTVTIKLIGPLRPIVLEAEDGRFTYMIMPIRLAG